MHRGGWFMRTFPALWAHILDGMRSQPGSGGDAGGALNVRCVELHHYATGGHLLQPKHRDNGSALTISVMLSDPASTSGGAFVTYDEGAPVVHALGHGSGGQVGELLQSAVRVRTQGHQSQLRREGEALVRWRRGDLGDGSVPGLGGFFQAALADGAGEGDAVVHARETVVSEHLQALHQSDQSGAFPGGLGAFGALSLNATS